MDKKLNNSVQRKKSVSIFEANGAKRQNHQRTISQRKTISRISYNERVLISLVENGELLINKKGEIFRYKKKSGLKTGGVQIVTLKLPTRAEHKTPQGYLQIRAMTKGIRLHCGASRLVWQYFNGDIPKGLCINHKNGIKDDNRPENLEVVTYSENTKHAYRIGLIDEHGENNPAHKLKNKEVAKIRYLYAQTNMTQKEIAAIYNITHQTVSRIVRGESRIKQMGKTTKINRTAIKDRDSFGRIVKSGKLNHMQYPIEGDK